MITQTIQPKLEEQLVYPSHYVEVLGSKMHYLDVGQGTNFLFIHGIPTWSYLWRHVIAGLEHQVRCIAPDLIGLGRSDKPDLQYTVFDHIRYINAFIDKLALKDVVLVMHGWGSVIGFDYLLEHTNNVKGAIFIEAYLKPYQTWQDIPLPVQELAHILNLPDKGQDVIMNSNYFVNKIMPAGTIRKLSETEMNFYREPFVAPNSCKPIWTYLQEVPIPGNSVEVKQLIEDYSEKIKNNPIPKLMLYAIPGFITTIELVKWARDHVENLTQIDIGEALHYAPEGNPIRLREEILKWYLATFEPDC